MSDFVTLSPIPGLVKWLDETGHLDAVSDVENDAMAQTRFAAYYLLNAKHHNNQPRDPVARFHLNNGALVAAVHAGADTSGNGMGQSLGVMVNYRYDLKRIAENHEAFANKYTVVAQKAVRTLADEADISNSSS